MMAQTAGEVQIGTHASSDGSCDSGVFQKCTANFTQGSLKSFESLLGFHRLLIK
jgi:hypothetical protein